MPSRRMRMLWSRFQAMRDLARHDSEEKYKGSWRLTMHQANCTIYIHYILGSISDASSVQFSRNWTWLRNGKLVWGAWMKRGFVSKELVAEARYGGQQGSTANVQPACKYLQLRMCAHAVGTLTTYIYIYIYAQYVFACIIHNVCMRNFIYADIVAPLSANLRERETSFAQSFLMLFFNRGDRKCPNSW